MLKLLLGSDWKKNSDALMKLLKDDIEKERANRILVVPESISHHAERNLCQSCGDSVSRYAEVLSFTRLLDRVCNATGCGVCTCMDAGGRVVSMAAAAMQLHSRLKAYASVETRPEFLTGLVETMDEFKRCCISADDLLKASQNTQGSLAQKLEELSLLVDAYDGICMQGKRDPSDQMTWLLEQLEDSSFAADHVFYFDGFTDFTGQQLAVVHHLIENSPNVIVALNCDRVSSNEPALQKAAQTAATLLDIAKKCGIETDVVQLPASDCWQSQIAQSLFSGNVVQTSETKKFLRVCQCENLSDECDFVADGIMELVRKGYRYRDIHVVCTNMDAYRSALNLAFSRRNIPMYIAGTEQILGMPIINTVLTALEAACGGFEQQNVLRYLRSALSPVDMDTCDLLENYAVMWNIHGSSWKREWVNHPDGFADQFDEKSAQYLAKLNEAREIAVAPLIKLSEGFASATTLKDQIKALYAFLENICLASRLEQIAADDFDNGVDAQVLSQLWEILLNALEQMHDALGNSVWESEMFVRLLKLLLSQYNVGTIPPVLDSVTIGTVTNSGWQKERYLFVMGASEGNLPAYGTGSGVLTEGERNSLRIMGLPLMGGALYGLQSEFADIYNIFSGASEGICVTCPSGQSSYVYRRLCMLAGEQEYSAGGAGAALCDPVEAGALLARHSEQIRAAELGVEESYRLFFNRSSHALGKVDLTNTTELYGKKLNLSASQVDKLADCRLAYFLKYGLRAKERKEVSVDPAEFGTFVHAILENTAKEIKKLGGFHKVTLEQTLKIAERYSEEYALQRFSQLDSQRALYLFKRNADELRLIVTELWEELQDSDFEPAFFELAFGDGSQMPAIQIPDAAIPAQLRGFVDRVDLWSNGSKDYFRVVDYKTGKKDFDYCDVFNGLGLQMLLYMFALEDNGQDLVGQCPAPAGVQYFPARVPLIPADSALSEEETKKARLKQWKRKGLILKDDHVLHAIENTDEPVRSGYTRKKDGSISGDLADNSQMGILKTYVFLLLKRLVDDIASGSVEPNPYTRGSSHNACAFCPYGAICHPMQIDGRRDYKAMSASSFWERVEKEVETSGRKAN